MKTPVLTLAVLLSLASAAKAQGADDVVANSLPRTATSATTSNFNTMMNSLSNMLSSTNPASGTASYPVSIPKPLPVPQAAVASNPVEALPPIHSAERPLPQEEASLEPELRPVVQPYVDVEKMSPETRRLLQLSGSGLGNEPKINPSKVRVNMERGAFDPEFGALAEKPIDGLQEVDKKPEKPKFEIKVETAAAGEDLIGLLEKGLRAIKAGQYESAVVVYKQALAKDKRNRDALFGIAVAYQKLGQRQQAKDYYGKLLTVYPNYQAGFNNVLIMASEEAPTDALAELDKLAARNPNFAPIYAQKAMIYSKSGANDMARQNFIRALTLQPDNVKYKYNLAILLDSMGDFAGATNLYRELLERGYKGEALPVDSAQIKERLVFIANKGNT